MKFEISRASIDDENEDPNVPGAYKETSVPYEGSDEVTDWYVDINTLEELMALRSKVGCDLILGHDSICIYDDYME